MASGTVRPTHPWIVAALLVASALLGCDNLAQEGAAGIASPPRPPAPQNAPPEADSGITRITLTEESAKRLGVRLAQLMAASTGLQAPHSALLHDASGGEWVYISPQPLVFKRVRVKVERIDGDKMYLAPGPAAGTNVVSSGAAQLLGAELASGAGSAPRQGGRQ